MKAKTKTRATAASKSGLQKITLGGVTVTLRPHPGKPTAAGRKVAALLAAAAAKNKF